MAHEIIFDSVAADLDLYAIIVHVSSGDYVNGTTRETYNADHWTDYAIPLTETGAGLYMADFPAVASGTYLVRYLTQQGEEPATTDTPASGGELKLWDGEAELTFYSIMTIIASIVAGIPNSGIGTFTVTQPVRTSTGAIMEGVWVKMRISGTDYPAISNAEGNAIWHINAGTYEESASYADYTFPAATHVISDHVTLPTLVGTRNSIPLPSAPEDCTVAFTAVHNGAPLIGEVFSFRCTGAPDGSGTVFIDEVRTATSDANAQVVIPLPKTSQWRGKAESIGVSFTLEVPNTSTYQPPNVNLER